MVAIDKGAGLQEAGRDQDVELGLTGTGKESIRGGDIAPRGAATEKADGGVEGDAAEAGGSKAWKDATQVIPENNLWLVFAGVRSSNAAGVPFANLGRSVS